MFSNESDLARSTLDEAEACTKAGDYAKALELHLWYHHNALEVNPGHYGVRLSFALSSWRRLGEKYTPALEALKSTRDKNVASLLSGTFCYETFHDVVSINQVLEEDNISIDVFRHIQTHDLDAAKECFIAIQDLLLEKNEWDLFYQHAGCLFTYMEECVKFHNRQIELFRTQYSIDMTPAVKLLNDGLVSTALTLIQISRSKNDFTTATKISQFVHGIIEDPRLQEEIS